MGFGPGLGFLNRRNCGWIVHFVQTGATGAISSQDLPGDSGVIATKTPAKTGRYTFALNNGKPLRKFHGGFASTLGPDDAVYGAKTKGNNFTLRDNDIDGGAADGTVELQFLNPSTDATNYIDAELPDNTGFWVYLLVSL